MKEPKQDEKAKRKMRKLAELMARGTPEKFFEKRNQRKVKQ